MSEGRMNGGAGVVRIVDYFGSAGGGVRFAAELLKAMAAAHPEVRFEFASHGPALARYRALLTARLPNCVFVDVPPPNYRDVRALAVARVRGGGALARAAGLTPTWHYVVPSEALGDAGVVWLPWLHRHRLPASDGRRVVGSFHDAIFFTESIGDHFHGRFVSDERETTAQWLASPAAIVTSSRATVDTMSALFGAPAGRFTPIPISGDHEGVGRALSPIPAAWAWAERPFLLTPSNVAHHKNHETLLAGVAAWGARHPVVLTGAGSDLAGSQGLRGAGERLGLLPASRGAMISALAERLGLRRGSSLIPLGYLDDSVYYALLNRAWALVMPTRAEGGGSFPVEEAVRSGVPVVCSGIPVMREHMDRLGAEVLWFDPADPDDLALRLRELEADYARYKRRAVEQIADLRRRSWRDVADDYWNAFHPT